MARAQARHRRIEARRRRLADAFAGAPLGMRARRYRAAGGRANLAAASWRRGGPALDSELSPQLVYWGAEGP